MKGDFTRFTFSPKKRYSSVRLQQGRVQLDADWNEQVDIQRYHQEAAQAAYIGQAGAPLRGGGFKIELGADQLTLNISPGRFYVAGLLCELFASGATYLQQPDYPNPKPLSELGAGIYIAYLDVFDQHVTALEDPSLRELALGGPDTTTRVKTACQIKLLSRSAWTADTETVALSQILAAPTGQLAARAHSAQVPPGAMLPPGSGYLRLDNQLYRVEIHQGGSLAKGAVTFKWSRENGTVVTPWVAMQGTDIVIGPSGQDEARSITVGNWVELTDDGRELRGEPGILGLVTHVEGPVLSLDTRGVAVNRSDFAADRNPKVRRWDMVGDTLPQVQSADWVALEDGIEVRFSGDTYNTGDYWLIPARAATRNIEWPMRSDAPVYLRPHGVTHHYAELAQLSFDGTHVTQLVDRRLILPSLADMRNQFGQLLAQHKHTGGADGTLIPRAGIENNAIDGSKIDPAAAVTLTKIEVTGALKTSTAEVTGGAKAGSLDVAGGYVQRGAELEVNVTARRKATTGDRRRALVHETDDSLTVNYNAEYSGGVKLNGKTVLLANTNPLYFGTTWDAVTDSVTNVGAIYNDTVNLKALAIVGNRSAGLTTPGVGRRVSIFDVLDVNGSLSTTSTADIGGMLNVKGADVRLDNTTRRGGRDGALRRALVHGNGDGNTNDLLYINYSGDYSSGVQIEGQLQLGGRLAMNENLISFRSAAGANQGLGYFGSSKPFAGVAVDGPVMFGGSGGVLGSSSCPVGDVSGAAYMTGGGYVDLPDLNDDFSEGFSFEAWTKWEYASGTSFANTSRVFDLGTGPEGDNILFMNRGVTNAVEFNVRRGSSQVTVLVLDNAFTAGTWVHFAATIDKSGNAVLYKNGVAVVTSTGKLLPNQINRTSTFIGKSNWSSNDTFVGRIAHVRLWKKALTASQITDHYDRSRPMNTSGLVAWWKLNDSSGTTVYDYSGLGRHATFLPGTSSSALESYQKVALQWDGSQNVTVPGRVKSGNTRSATANVSSKWTSTATSAADVDGLVLSSVMLNAGAALVLVTIGGLQIDGNTNTRAFFSLQYAATGSTTYTTLATSVHEFSTNGYALRDLQMHALISVSGGTYNFRVQCYTNTTSSTIAVGYYNSNRQLTVIEL